MEGLDHNILRRESSSGLHGEDKLAFALIEGHSPRQTLILGILVALVAQIALLEVFDVDGLPHRVVSEHLARARINESSLLLDGHL